MVPGAEYDVEDDCYVVFDVLFEQERVDHYTGFDFADVELPPPGYAGYGTAIGGMGSYSDFVSLLQYRKMGMQVTSSDPDWYFNDVTRKLSFSPSTGPATRVIYRYMTNSIDFGRMTMYQKSIVKRYALSQALLVVGLARSKFSSLPGTEGDITLNGSELIGQSEIMASGLEEKIKSMRKPIPIVVG